MKPLSSMTGFASKTIQTEVGPVTCEIKSVNSRFQELYLKLAEQFRGFEPQIRTEMQKRVSRGKIEIRLSLQNEDAVPTELDETALAHLLEMQKSVLKVDAEAKPMGVSQILLFPGVLRPKSTDKEAFDASILGLFESALTDFIGSRQREGEALGKILLGICDQIEKTVDAIEPKIPEIIQAMKDKLTERLEEALNESLTGGSSLTSVEVSDRIRQEVTLYAMKLDVQEEIGRLRTHVNECRRVIKAGGLVGRRLDFLMQELNREANTLGSKAASIEMTDTSVALKVAIEQMREQIQNLE